MSQFRSEEMNLVQLFVQSDAAHDTLHELGQIGAIQFKDLNKDKTAFQRIFVQDVRKCEDMLRIVRYLRGLHAKEKIKVSADEPANMSSLQELHEKLQEVEKEMKEHTDKYSLLVKQRTELDEHLQVLNKASQWFGQVNRAGIEFPASTAEEGRNEMSMLLEDGGEGAGSGAKRLSMLGHLAGCIPTANLNDFRMTLFRATRGNMHLQHQPVDRRDLSGDTDELKSVFIVYFSGERSRQKIAKICDSYAATTYAVSDSATLRDREEQGVKERLRDLEIVIRSTGDYRKNKLRSIAGSILLWEAHVMREKAVFHTLNLFNYDVTNKCLIAEGWCPTMMLPSVRDALRKGTLKSGAAVQSVINIVKTNEMPPTYFRTNKLTKGFQSIVDAYGCAKYQEMNPAVFTVITFPFLFGVMFGDIGHGFMMTLAAALLCMFETKLAHWADDEMLGTVYHGRYCILLMGFFATYSGFIYNELFSVPMELWGSTLWCSGEMNDPECAAIPGTSPQQLQKWPRTNINKAWDFSASAGGSTGEEVVWDNYPFGSDPGWAHTANKLNSANSFKMKFAIVIGVAQMVMGVCCKLMNTLFWQDMITLYFVFIPEIVFINSIFGYLVILILTKWTTNWDTSFILNNYEIVTIPQIYCKDDLSNVPCWTAPFQGDRALVPGYGSQLEELPEYQWCMKPGAPTAGCAVYKYNGKLIVESNSYGNSSYVNPAHYNPGACAASPDGCMLWKQSPPSLLDSLIKMFMEPGSVPIENQLIPGQGPLQALLILVALVSVPMLLFPKPFLLKRKHEEKMAQRGSFQPLTSFGHDTDSEAGGDHGHGHGHGDEFEFGEVMVHQMIHTIEYVLGCISNTASYLRLWALSLAHAQLSEVFWEKTVVEVGMESSSPMLLFITIGAWSLFTVGVLMGMESLSAFLHALRLHWVEFMNKFYDGTGIVFKPFSFDSTQDED